MADNGGPASVADQTGNRLDWSGPSRPQGLVRLQMGVEACFVPLQILRILSETVRGSRRDLAKEGSARGREK